MYSPTITPYTPANLQNTMAVLAAEKAKGTLQQYVQQHLAQNPNDTNMVALATQVNKMSAPLAQMPSNTVANQDIASMAPPRPIPVQGMAPAGAGPNMPNGMPMQGPGSPAQIAPQVAQGLPEDTGIGALPAQNLTKMAGGGITGDVHRYNGAFDPQLVSTNPHAPGGAQYYYDFPYNPRMPMDPKYKPLMGQVFKSPEEAQTAFSRIGSADYTAAAGAPGIAQLLGQEQPTPTQLNTSLTGNADADAGNTSTGAGNPPAPPTPWSPNIQAPKLAMPGGLNTKALSPAEAKATANTFLDPTQMDSRIAQLHDDTVGRLNDLTTAQEAMLRARPKFGEELKKDLDKEKAEEVTKLGNLKGMSLAEAGLAMMQGTSPYAFANIGKGGVEGLKAYKEGLKEIDAAAKERRNMYSHIDDMNKAQMVHDQDTAMAMNSKAFDAMSNLNEHAFNAQNSFAQAGAGIAAGAYSQSQQDVNANKRTMFSAQNATANTQAELNFKAALANLPPEAIRSAQFLGKNGDIEDGLRKMTEIQAGKLNPMQAYLDQKKALAGKLDPITGQPVPMQDPQAFFADLNKAMLAYKTMQGPDNALSNNPPAVLRGQ